MSMQTMPSAEQRLYELGERLEQWRQTKTKRSDPIPETLWSQAITLTQTLPLRRVSKALGLSSYDLKRRIDRLEPPSQPSAPPINFIELPPVNGQAKPRHLTDIELERSDGARLRIQYPEPPPLESLIRSFLASR